MTVAPIAKPEVAPCLVVEGLTVALPDGRLLLDDVSLSVRPGEVVVILGGSGAGKSTFSRVLFERAALERDGFRVGFRTLAIDPDELGLVPQRGALFDHLDVRGNLELAARYGDREPDAPGWLERVGLDRALAEPGTKVGALSGGQAQRVAVARALAGGRRLLFLDEPSVGLDPHRVRRLARLVRAQAADGVAAIVVTHDPALAAGAGDRLFVLDPATRRLEPLFTGEWPGPLEHDAIPDSTRGQWIVRLEQEMVDRIARAPAPDRSPRERRAPAARAWRAAREAGARLAFPFAVAAASLRRIPGQLARRPRDFAHVALRVARQTIARPLLFYLIVAALIGYTVLYVISKVGGPGVGAQTGIRVVGGSYVIALAPVLSAVLYVAASANATNAWLGSMGLTRQVLAMEALGVDARAYLWGPAWLALGLGYLVVAALFAAGMFAGGLALCAQHGVPGAWDLLTGDLFDPRPERVKWVARSLFLIWCYGWGIASDIVAKGAAEKREADDVTHGMTRSVVACTLWVVAWELATAIVVFAA